MSVSSPPALPRDLSYYDIRTLAVIHTLEVIAAMLVAFRIYWRVRERKDWLWEWMWTDVFLVLALVLQMGIQILNVFEILESLEQYQHKGWTFYAGIDASFVTVAAFWCLRVSVALLFLEIFPGNASKIIAYSAIGIISIASSICIFWYGSCFWPLANRHATVIEVYAKCSKPGYPMYPSMIIHSLTGLIFDVFAVVLPLFPILPLRMTPAKKFYVVSVFALGWLTVAASAARFSFSIHIIRGSVTPKMTSSLTIFSAVEMHVGLIASSLITSWRVIRRKLFRSGVQVVPVDFEGHDGKDVDGDVKIMDTEHSAGTMATVDTLMGHKIGEDVRCKDGFVVSGAEKTDTEC